jgi:hypothetical protein
MKNEEIITEIQKIRNKNNICWMDILRLAFKSNEEKAKKIFTNITNNDQEINKLSKKLAGINDK